MKGLISAVSFLTIIPLRNGKGTDAHNLDSASLYFPVAGLLIGAILYTINLLQDYIPGFFLAVLIVFVLTLLTGGLHLDGLADTVDGFYAARGREDILRIMRDSHIGSMGVLALILIILFKVALIYSIPYSLRGRTLVIFPVISRWSMVFSMFAFNYARNAGRAALFFNSMTWKKMIAATILTVIPVYLLFNITGIILVFVIAAGTYSMNLYVKSRIGGITGDTIGAVNEVNEVLSLCLIYAAANYL